MPSDLQQQIDAWRDNLDDISDIARYNRLKGDIKNVGLLELAELCDTWDTKPAEELTNLFKWTWYDGLTREGYRLHESLRQFDREVHEKNIDNFVKMDRDILLDAQHKLIAAHYHSLPPDDFEGMKIIQREIRKARRILPIRRLLEQAGEEIQEIKPVFMMSPMSVATYLSPGEEGVDFDLVVFDEASQLRPEDALGALLRTQQVVVVGDEKQMPPTNFFRQTLELDEEAEDDQDVTAGDIKSILSLFLSKGFPSEMLRWHYRSKHESLIAVSNQEFYDGKLVVFPSSGKDSEATGLRLICNQNNLYDRGASGTNPDEARAIAQKVMEHAMLRPHLSLGVVAFSDAQRERIFLEVEDMRKKEEHCELEEKFFTKNRSDGENFFIKNLENVQGDERDIIYISIGYGWNEQGTLAQNFGPINRDGGARRLNVLFTRAKLGMSVFSNFVADNLRIEGKTSEGVKVLRSFLHFAEKKKFPVVSETGREEDGPFERDVRKEIEKMGYRVEPQVGSAGYFIDLAVRHPEKHGQYILAVECDGASYHSAASARVRDRLRQESLENLGWKFHRVWSTDWFLNRAEAVKRLQDAIEKQINIVDEQEVRFTDPEQQKDKGVNKQ